jgi:hypothetical protein
VQLNGLCKDMPCGSHRAALGACSRWMTAPPRRILCANLCVLAPFVFWHPLRACQCVMTLGGAFSASCIGLLSMQRNIAQVICLIIWPRLVSRFP